MAKRILVFTNHYRPENFKINEVVDWLIEAGHIVHVITAWPNYPSGKLFSEFNPLEHSFEKKGNLSIRRLPIILRGQGTKVRLIANYVSYFISTLCYTLYLIFFKKKYDKVLVHHTSPFFIAFSGILYKRTKRVEALLWDLDLWPETLEAVGFITSKRLLNWIRYFVLMIYRHFNVVLVSSKGFLNEVKKRVPHQNIFYFPNWAESALEENKIKDITIDNLKTNAIKILYAGNIGFAQGFESLTKAIISLPKGLFQWVFIGDGRYLKKLKIDLAEQIINKDVLIIPQQKIEDIPSYTDKADFLYVSLNDNPLFKRTVPAKLQGYMTAKKPILGRISGEGAAIIKESYCGYFVSSDNVEQLKNMLLKISKLTSNKRDHLANNGLSYYKENFHSSIRKEQLLEIIKM